MNGPPYRLLASAGTGSAIVEAALELAGLDHVIEEIDYDTLGPGSETIGAINPLGQVSALVLPDGRVLTESAAMVLHIADRAPEAGLVPAAEAPQRPVFLRWLVFLVAAIYPTFTFGDEPGRWVSGEAAIRELRQSTNRHREELWRYLKYEAIYLFELSDGFKAERVIGDWLGFYNSERPHSAHDGRTPAEAYGITQPVDMMGKTPALSTSPQAQQLQQDVINRILAA